MIIKKKIAMGSGIILLVVLAGVAGGALLGILFAPDMGWNTRKRISKKGEDYVDALKEKFTEFINGFSVNIDNLKEEVIDFSEQGKPQSPGAEKDVNSTTG
jgi:gas vesicle protein